MTTTAKPIESDVLHRSDWRVDCDHPSGERVCEYGVNGFWFDNAADAMIRAIELRTLGRGHVKVSRRDWHKVRRQGQRKDRDVFRWSTVEEQVHELVETVGRDSGGQSAAKRAARDHVDPALKAGG